MKINNDKWMHLAISAFLSFIFSLFMPSYIAIFVTIAIGIGAEICDKVSGKCSSEWQDLLVDVIGAAIGAL